MAKEKFFSWKVWVLITALIGSGFFVWFKEKPQDLQKFWADKEREYVEAMTADTYGGATPQETLDLFVAALEAEDVELASKYFMLDENLSREKWENKLKDLKLSSSLNKLAELLKKSVPNPKDIINKNDFKYVLKEDGKIKATINFEFNSFSNVWKIESI